MRATGEVLAADLMTHAFVRVAPDDTLGEVAERMAESDTGSVLVEEHGRLTGVLTSRDVLRALASRAHPSEAHVREWMTADPVTASPDTAVEEAAYMMIAGGFHHLPVVEDERLLGVIGLRAVIGFRKPGLPGL